MLEKREIQPDAIFGLERRPGTLRSARRAYALGLKCFAPASYGYTRKRHAAASEFSLIGSLFVGHLPKDGEYPVAMLRAGATSTDSMELFLSRSGATFVLKMRATSGTPTSAASTGIAVSPEDRIHFLWSLNSGTGDLELEIQGDATGTETLAVGGLGAFTGPYWIESLGNALVTAKPTALHPRLDNLAFFTTRQASTAALFGTRAPGSPNLYFRLDQGGDSIASTGSTADTFFLHPAPPALVSGSAEFGGRSGAFRIPATPDLEQFWSTDLRAVARDKFGWYLKGVKVTPVAREETLLDYGGLGIVKVTAGNLVTFTYNGTTISTTVTLEDADAYQILAGRDGTTLYLRLISDNNETIASTFADIDPPRLDYSRARDVLLGAAEDPDSAARYTGGVDTFAFFPFAVREAPQDKTGALFWYGFSDWKDESRNRVTGVAVAHSAASGRPVFAPAAILDAPYVHVAGGQAIAESALASFDGGVCARLASGMTTHRIGPLLLGSSGGRGMVADLEREIMRPLGMEYPGAEVSCVATAPGSLNGVVCYGYAFQSHHGTVGPLRRLKPLVVQNGKVVIGSTTETGGSDQESELGETFGRTVIGGESRFRLPFAGGAPADGTYPVEIHARAPAFDDPKEDIWHRGSKDKRGNNANISYFSSGIGASAFNPNGNWTIQRAFRYKAPPTTAFREAVGICGFGKESVGNIYNQDFVAYLTNEGWGAARPRLVVGVSRSEFRRTYPTVQWYLHANYKLLTFSNDSTWPTLGGDFWTADHDYNLVISRSGDAVVVRVYDATRGAWATLTGSSMASLPSAPGDNGATIPSTGTYDGTDLFSGWRSFVDTRAFHFGSAAANRIEVPDISAGGAVDTDNYYDDFIAGTFVPNNGLVRGSPGTMVHYHSRVWSRALSESNIKNFSMLRYAADVGEPLNTGILVDLGHLVEDETEEVSTHWDKAGQLPYKCLSDSLSAVTFIHAAQDDSALAPESAVLAAVAANGTTLANSKVALTFSELGNGRMIMRVGSEGSFVLTEKLWTDAAVNPAFTRVRGDFSGVNPFDEFNWYAFALIAETSGGNTTFTVEGLAVNAIPIFNTRIGGGTTMATSAYAGGFLHLGGAPNTSNCQIAVEMGEFRWWDLTYGPEPKNGQDFEYQAGRVPSHKHSEMLVYAKFQPRDEYNGGAGLASGANLLYHYGTLGGSSGDEFSMLGTNDTYRARIHDTRTEATGGGTDPIPLVAIPGAPSEDVATTKWYRTDTVPVLDFDDDAEVQDALLSARGQPLRFLVDVPIGQSHFVDGASDAILRAPRDERNGFVPDEVGQIATWKEHALIVGEYGWLHFSEPGPFGWESYPAQFAHRVQFEDEADAVKAVAILGDNLAVFGPSSMVLLGGGPSAPVPVLRVADIGAASARCVASDGLTLYAYNGALWAFGQNGKQNIGRAVEDLLPPVASARLVISEALGSLLLINESSGVVLRYSFRVQDWFVESRDALSLGDLADGYGLVTRHGAYAESDGAEYGDDLDAASPGSVAGTKSGSVVTLTPTGLTVGMRCGLKDAAGALLDARITVVGGGSVTFDDLTGLADGAVTVYPGAPSEGMLLDTGPVRANGAGETMVEHLNADILAGSGLEYAVGGYQHTDGYASRSNLTWEPFGEDPSGAEARGARVRIAVRSLIPQDTRLGYLEATLR